MATFRPAGLEDESSDEDGFSFGADRFQEKVADSPNISAPEHVSTETRGGFGKPPPRSQPFLNPQQDSRNQIEKTTKWGPKDKAASRSKPIHSFRQATMNGSSQNGYVPKAKPPSADNKPTWLQSDAIPIDDFRAAVTRNNVDLAKYYLDQGIEVDTVFSTGWTALMYASNYALEDIMKVLVDNGADVNFNKDLYTVLMAACASNNSSEKEGDILKAVQLLLEKGADINAFDRHHVSPLLYATRKGRISVVKHLIEAGAHIDKQDNKGYTALMLAAYQGHLRLIQVLLEAGADHKKQATDSSRAIDIAAINGHKQAEELLRNKDDPVKVMNMDSLQEECAAPLRSHGSQSMYELQGGSATDLHKFGELELFLSALDVAHLIPLFRNNEINFKDFLRFTDKDLRELGVESMGVRKKILDTIRDTHKKSWETSSTAPIQYNKKITCAEAVAMVGNIKKHASYISSSIGYISDQIKADRDILANAQEGSGGDELSIQTEEAITNVKFLYEELAQLRHFLTEAADRPEFNPPDLIKLKEKKTKATGIRLSIKLVLAGSVICSMIYIKKDFIFQGLNSLNNKLLS